jgi:hypothetical protein
MHSLLFLVMGAMLTPGSSSNQPNWAMATLITLSAGKRLQDHAITYTHQAVLLGKQVSERYPNVPRLAVVKEGQVGADDVAMLEAAGYTVLLRPGLTPAYVKSRDPLAHVYYDQYMKFWLWNETGFDRIVYMDSDTYFTNTSLINFEDFLPLASEDRVVACPTPWSLADEQSLPITWNGGFFIMQPSRAKFDGLTGSPTPPSHFMLRYGSERQWFDTSEMGAFMRDFPAFSTPFPLWEYCAEVQPCCVEARCETRFAMPKKRGAMVHGLKPDGPVQAGRPLSSIFDHQRIDVFKSWGYDPECLREQFYEPLTRLYAQYGLLSSAP